MEEDGILYISENLSNLMGIPTRVYKNKELINMYTTVHLYKDPFLLCDYQLDKQVDNLTYFSAHGTFYYCMLRCNEYQIVIGPFRYFTTDNTPINDLAFTLGLPKDEKTRFISAISSISTMPIETVIQSLCSYNYVLTGEKLSIQDVTIIKDKQDEIVKEQLNEKIEEDSFKTLTRNSTLQIEETLCRIVEDGNLDAFNQWLKTAPSIRAGSMSPDFLRHQKNTFIVSATIFSRAAIKGGLEYNEALDISDSYISKMESCKTYPEVTNLSYAMLKEYITKVNKVKSKDSPLESKIANYVYSHISEPITLDDLCGYLYTSKSNLCLRFKKETGLTISQFILEKKIDESKLLLKDTSKSISSIALYLGFSSQAHFTKVFKSIEGVSPLQYRNKPQK